MTHPPADVDRHQAPEGGVRPQPFRPSRVLVPLVTPFRIDGRVDHSALERLAQTALDAGAEGIVALGTTAETTSLTDEERQSVVRVCADVCSDRRAPLIIAAGTNDTRTTVERHAALADVDAARASLAVVPYYVRPTEAAIVEHFRVVAARSPVPLIIYNIPYRTGRGLGHESLLELAHTANIVGVKQAVGALDLDTLRLLRDAPSGFSVLGGDDAFLYPLIAMGAAGAIAASANVATEFFVAMIDAGLNGAHSVARGLAEHLLPLVDSLFAEPNPAVIKGVLHARTAIDSPALRMPLAAASATAVQRASAELSQVLARTLEPPANAMPA